MWSKILIALGTQLVERLAKSLWELFVEWKADRELKKDINEKVKRAKEVKTPEEIRRALDDLMP